MDKTWLQQHVQYDETISAGSEIAEIVTELNLIEAEQTKHLLETIFTEVFLPLFLGTPIEERKYKQVDLNNWATYAGGPYREVHVVDQNDKIIFTVPPLYDRTALNPAAPDRRTGSVLNMIKTAQQLQHAGRPAQAREFLINQLQGRIPGMSAPNNILRHLRAWNTIFTRYGHPPVLEIPGDDVKSTEQGEKDAEIQKLDQGEWDLL